MADDVRKSENRIQRRAQLVAHIRQELRFCAIGDFGPLLGFPQEVGVGDLRCNVGSDPTVPQKLARFTDVRFA